MRNQLLDLIEHESTYGPEGHIQAKLNSLADPGIIDALYRASQTGTRIDLLVRGICCLVPGVPRVSETIRVRSLLGRYLEHSRIVRFAHGNQDAGHPSRADDQPLFLIGSADWMPRNLDKRIEVYVPVTHPKHQTWLGAVFEHTWADDVVRWELDAEGLWHRRARRASTRATHRSGSTAGCRPARAADARIAGRATDPTARFVEPFPLVHLSFT
ncbi:MAG: hypothetical protein R2713_18205 [Ilumatobacteraceae bacterium]